METRTTVRLPEELMRRAKRKAAAEGRTLTSLIEQGLRRVVEEPAPTPSLKRHVTIPVSKATGGFLPGINLDRMSDYYALEDEEYIERLRNGFK